MRGERARHLKTREALTTRSQFSFHVLSAYQRGSLFRERISLPGKTPNNLKFRYFERANVIIKLGVKRSFGLFISAECERSQNAHNRSFTCH